jgi:hypothetical protein
MNNLNKKIKIKIKKKKERKKKILFSKRKRSSWFQEFTYK